MVMRICSQYPKELWVAIMNYRSSCGPITKRGQQNPPWEQVGWWSLTTGQCKIVFSGSYPNNNFYYFAQADDGAAWSGPHENPVTLHAFRFCVGKLRGADLTVGYRLLDVTKVDDFTLTLIP
jgi:uncharacterized membrane protein